MQNSGKFIRSHLASVRLRLTLWNVAGLALLLLGLGVLLRTTVQRSLTRTLDQRLVQEAQWVQSLVQDAQQVQDANWVQSVLSRPPGSPPLNSHPHFSLGVQEKGKGLDDSLEPRILSRNGQRLPPFHATRAWDPDTIALSAQGQEVFSNIQTGNGYATILSVPLQREGHIIGVIQVGSETTEEDHELRRLTHALLTLIPLVLLLAAGSGALLTEVTLRPVKRITKAAGQIEAQDLSERLPVSGSDEFGTLAATFNGMLTRLENAFVQLKRTNGDLAQSNQRLIQSYEQQRRFTADASHELRTPLTVIKANTSYALLETRSAAEYQEILEAVDRAADRTSRLVQDLLLLARADADEFRLPLTPLNLQDVLAQTLEASGCLDDPRICFKLNSNKSILGHNGMLVRLFGNLLTNALRHTPASGEVIVTLEDRVRQVLVTVQDTGQGIAPEHLPHLFERFYRADEARSEAEGGTGLGLAICRSVTEAHGGSIQIASIAGAGTTVKVTLPSF